MRVSGFQQQVSEVKGGDRQCFLDERKQFL